MTDKRVLVGAGLGALLVTGLARGRVGAVPAALQRATRRRRLGLPRGVEEYPSTLVDKRHTDEPTAPVAAAQTPVDVIAEHYQEHRPQS